MARVNVTKKDVIWSYVAQILNLGSGLFILPLILHMLSANEIAMNYLMLTVASFISLLDFGFLPQFARNLTYVFSGVPDLEKEGVLKAEASINYTLLSNMIGVAKKVYSIIGSAAFIYYVTLVYRLYYQLSAKISLSSFWIDARSRALRFSSMVLLGWLTFEASYSV